MPELQSKPVQRHTERPPASSAASAPTRGALRGMSYDEGAATLAPGQGAPVQMKRAVQREEAPEEVPEAEDLAGTNEAGPPGPEQEAAPVPFGEVVPDGNTPQVESGETLRVELLLLNAQLDGLRIQATTAGMQAGGGGHVTAVAQKQAGDTITSVANGHADGFKASREGAPQVARELGHQAKRMYEQACSAYALATQVSREAGRVRTGRLMSRSTGQMCDAIINSGRKLAPEAAGPYAEGMAHRNQADGLGAQIEAMSPTQESVAAWASMCATACELYVKAHAALADADFRQMRAPPPEEAVRSEPTPVTPKQQEHDIEPRTSDEPVPDMPMPSEAKDPKVHFAEMGAELEALRQRALQAARFGQGESATGAGATILANADFRFNSAEAAYTAFKSRVQDRDTATGQVSYQTGKECYLAAEARYNAIGRLDLALVSARAKQDAARNASPVCAQVIASGDTLTARAQALHQRATGVLTDTDWQVDGMTRTVTFYEQFNGWIAALHSRAKGYDEAVLLFRQADAEQQSGPGTPYRR